MSAAPSQPAPAREWQFDGLVGPTHNYAGLSYGNLAATSNAGSVSNPRMAALQGIEKMRFVRNLGIEQSFLPPHYRPTIPALKRIGFEGGTSKILEDAARSPQLLASVFSSAFMWAANGATVAPSADSADGKVHLTPANLISHFHRSLEAGFTTRLLRRIFGNSQFFTVHEPLPAASLFSDEGAANHMLATSTHGSCGMHVFVFGTEGGAVAPARYPARQTRAACEAVARNHRLSDQGCLFLQQHPDSIDRGVFHNDVIAMNTTRLMIAHEKAYLDASPLRKAMSDIGCAYIEIGDEQLGVGDAVASYFFNSQLLDPGDGRLVLVAPAECEGHEKARAVIDSLSGGNGPLSEVHYLDVRESMRNGGGPACLRLRVAMTGEEGAAIHPGVIATDEKLDALTQWVKLHYRDRLCFDDLRDPGFITELNEAYEALERLIGMPNLYDL
ncbi:MAG: N-succinylarginine dihydrolase [Alphaproteobacteria bacterium]